MRGQQLYFYSFLFIIISLLNTSCTAIKSYPDRPVDAEDQLKELSWCFKYNDIKTPNPINQDLTVWRDMVINCQIYAIDLNFTLFEQSLARENINLNTGTDLAVIGLGAGTAIIGSATTKSILGAISGGITGAKGSIDKDIFFSKTMPALLSQMEAQRKTQLLKIRNGLQNKADKYPLSEALIDVEDYYKAGSIPAALQGIVEQSGSEAKEATKKLKELLPASDIEVDQISKVRKRFNELYNTWNKAKESDAGKKALADATTVLQKLEPSPPPADGEALFHKLNDQIKLAGPGSEQLKKVISAFGI
jgi:hypothetical protein